jgi:elongation factor G
MILAGMGELHLEILRHRIERDFKMQVRVGAPRVAYRQTITRAAEAEAVFDRVLPGRVLYAGVRLRLDPAELGAPVEVLDQMDGKEVPALFHPSIVSTVRATAGGGGALGFPLNGLTVTLLGGSAREQGSSEAAFGHAAHMAFEKALEAAGPVVLEPVMDFEIACPQELLAGVNADLNGRRAQVRQVTNEAGTAVVRAACRWPRSSATAPPCAP